MERSLPLEAASFYMEVKQMEAIGTLPYKTQEDKTGKRWASCPSPAQPTSPHPEITKSILCKEKGEKLLETYGAEGVFIDQNKKVTVTKGLKDKFTILNKEYKQ